MFFSLFTVVNQSGVRAEGVKEFMVLVQRAYGDANTAVHIQTPLSSVFATLNRAKIDQATPSSFQAVLRDKHIIIPDFNLPKIACDRQGITSLNGLREVVEVEGKLIVTHSGIYLNK